MPANKRIPVSEDRWRELGDLKRAGQTWDELLGEMAESYKKRRLAELLEETDDVDFEDVTDGW